MYINVIDYRGDPASSIFQLRTRKFLEVQQDFQRWQQHGHKFVCWTQHSDMENLAAFDEIHQIPRSNAGQARNYILDHYPLDSWIGIWDNDATLYWDKLKSKDIPRDLDQVIEQANQLGLYGFVPFDARQTPYPEYCPDTWSFRSTIILKGTMCFLKVSEIRYDTTMTALEDMDYACQHTVLNRKLGRLEQISLREVSANHSTIFNATNRKYLYARNKEILADRYSYLFKKDRLGENNKFIVKRLGELQRSYWNKTILNSLANIQFTNLFEQ